MQNTTKTASTGPGFARILVPAVVLWLLAGAGCATAPAARSDALAAAAGASRTVMQGEGFEHVVFSRGLDRREGEVHVYLGGDGRAFLSRHRVAADPTPGRPLGLQLMLADPAPAVYVGRPCYLGSGPAERCNPELWTTARYGATVIDSVAAVVRELAARDPAAELTLLGYSGGGVVALLVAAQVPQVSRVVTLAAPLDLAAWTEAHGYTPLLGSIDPASVTKWPPSLRQVHAHGARDRNVAPAMIARFRDALSSGDAPATFRVMDDFDHVCCWLERWPRLLDALSAGQSVSSHAKL
jgi:hypothetical protein